MAAKVTVYTMDFCPFCERAKGLLKERGIAYEEINVPMSDEAQWDALEKKTGMKTMPQILHGEKLIGGFSDLAAIDKKDRLESLKA
jgi:glutaredoxin 3